MLRIPRTSRREKGKSGVRDDNAGQSQQAPVVLINQRQFTTVTNIQNEGPSLQRSSVGEQTRRDAAQPSTDIESLCSKLIEVSRKQASELCGSDESTIIGVQKINIATLELSTQTKNSDLVDESGHYNHRKEIAEVFNKPPNRNIHYSQLFNKARDNAIDASEKLTSTWDAKEKYQLVHGNVVGVVGQAGIGKTTLSKLLVREILDQSLYDAEYIFYLHFRDLDYTKHMNLLQFLTNHSSFSNNITKQDLTQLLDKVSKSNRAVIICDGLDEATMKKKSKPLKGQCSIDDTVKAETFIKHILCGDLLPRAKKLFTSRPRQLFHLHKSYRPRFVVNVLGLNEDAQKQICRDICENDDVCNRVFEFVNDRPDLKSFCYISANCIMVMHCIHVNFQLGHLAALENMDSISTVMVATLGHFIKNGHLRDEEFQTKNLSTMAYIAFVSNRLFFEQKHLERAGISIQHATTFLTTRLDKKAAFKLWEGIVTVKSYFSHILLHEFFVAVYLILFMKADEFKEVLSKLKKNKYEMVAKFSFGLCNAMTQGYLQDLIPSEELNLSHYEKKKEMLEKLALKKVVSAQNFIDLLQVCSWFYELRDDEITQKALPNLGSEIEISGSILPSDIPAFQYMLQLKKTPLTLIIAHPDTEKDEKKSFFVVLDAMFRSTDFKIKDLKLKWNDIDEDEAVYLASAIQSVMELDLGRSNINQQGIRALSSAIKRMANPMQKLDLSFNDLGDDGAIHLATCIDNVETLILSDCWIGASGVEALSQAIQQRKHSMKKLDLSSNYIGKKGAKSLQACLHNIETINVEFLSYYM